MHIKKMRLTIFIPGNALDIFELNRKDVMKLRLFKVWMCFRDRIESLQEPDSAQGIAVH